MKRLGKVFAWVFHFCLLVLSPIALVSWMIVDDTRHEQAQLVRIAAEVEIQARLVDDQEILRIPPSSFVVINGQWWQVVHSCDSNSGLTISWNPDDVNLHLPQSKWGEIVDVVYPWSAGHQKLARSYFAGGFQ